MSGRFRRGRVIVGTCSAWSAYCRDVFCEVWLVSVSVRRGLLSVGTCSSMSDYYRDVLGEVGLVSRLVR